MIMTDSSTTIPQSKDSRHKNEHQPFQLRLTIHKAKNIFVSTSTTDPYVVIFLGEKLVGQTEVKTNTYNPAWEETFEIPLKHLQIGVKLRVFDQNSLTSDELIGYSAMDLSLLQESTATVKSLPLLHGITSKPTSGEIFVSATIVKNHIVHLKASGHVQTSDPALLSVIQREVSDLGILDPVAHNLKKSQFLVNHLQRINTATVKDLLFDMKSVAVSQNGEFQEGDPQQFKSPRHSHAHLWSSHITLGELGSSPASQIFVDRLSLELMFSSELGRPSVFIVFPNKFLLFLFVQWLTLAANFWRQESPSGDDLPHWAIDHNNAFRSAVPLKVLVSGSGTSSICYCSIFLDTPFEIRLDVGKSAGSNIQQQTIPEKLDLHGLDALVIHGDSLEPQKFSIVVDSIHVELSKTESSPPNKQSHHEAESAFSLSVVHSDPVFSASYGDSRAHAHAHVHSSLSWKPKSLYIGYDLLADEGQRWGQSDSAQAPATIVEFSCDEALQFYLNCLPTTTSVSTEASGTKSLLAHGIADLRDLMSTMLAADTQALLASHNVFSVEPRNVEVPLYSPRSISLTLTQLAGDFKDLVKGQSSIAFKAFLVDWEGNRIMTVPSVHSPQYTYRAVVDLQRIMISFPLTHDLQNAHFIKIKIFTYAALREKTVGYVCVPVSHCFDSSMAEGLFRYVIQENSLYSDAASSGQALIALASLPSPMINMHALKGLGGGSTGGSTVSAVAAAAAAAGESGSAVMGLGAVMLSLAHEFDSANPIGKAMLTTRICRNEVTEFLWPAESILDADLSELLSLEKCKIACSFTGLQITLQSGEDFDHFISQHAFMSGKEEAWHDVAAVDNAAPVSENAVAVVGVEGRVPESVATSASASVLGAAATPLTGKEKGKASQTAHPDSNAGDATRRKTSSCCSCFSPRPARQGYSQVSSPQNQASDVKSVVSARLQEFQRFPNYKFRHCEERDELHSDTFELHWDRVESAEVITASTLAIRVKIRRYFGVDSSNQNIYKGANVLILVTSCPALELLRLINDRKYFSSIRRNVAIAFDSVEGDIGAVSSPRSYDSHDREIEIPTVELPYAASYWAGLDSEAGHMEVTSAQLGEKYLQTRDAKYCEEQFLIDYRICRLRLYIATLLGADIGGKHAFSDEQIAELVAHDVCSMQKLVLSDEISTANTRIEFLLDMAENRLRDATLRGWDYRGGPMEKVIEHIVNSYLVDMTALLGKFFRSQKDIKIVKGLKSKVELLLTCMKHDDRLDELLTSVLRPYDLVAEPKPLFSLFINIDTIVAWYTQLVDKDMIDRLDTLISVFKDPTKNPEARAMYTHQLPWIPSRLRGTSGLFLSALPEDTTKTLSLYIEYARPRKEEVARSFHAIIQKLEDKVYSSFVNCFTYLADTYWDAMGWKDWTKEDAGVVEQGVLDQMEEHFEWLASVANDARRICTSRLLHAGESAESHLERKHSDQELDMIDKTSASYSAMVIRAVDHLSCVVFKIVSLEQPLWTKNDAFTKWMPAYTSEIADDEHASTFKSFANELSYLRDYLISKIDYLDPSCYHKLVLICADKVVLRYLFLLKSAQEAGRDFETYTLEVAQMTTDICAIKDCFQAALDLPPVKQFVDTVTSQFRVLDFALVLITCDHKASEFSNIWKTILKIAQGHPEDALAWSQFVQSCILLRHDVTTLLHSSGPAGSQPPHQHSGSGVRAGGKEDKKKSRFSFSVFTKRHSESPRADLNEETAIAQAFYSSIIAIVNELKDYYEPTDSEVELVYRNPVAKVFSPTHLPDPLTTFLLHSTVPLNLDTDYAVAAAAVTGGGAGGSAYETPQRLKQNGHTPDNRRHSTPLTGSKTGGSSSSSGGAGAGGGSYDVSTGSRDGSSWAGLGGGSESGSFTHQQYLDSQKSSLSESPAPAAPVAPAPQLVRFASGRFCAMENSGDNYIISVSGLRAELSALWSKVKAYMVVSLAGKTFKTLAVHVDTKSSLGAYAWDNEFEFSLGRTALNFHLMNFTLVTKGLVYGEEKIGTVTVPLSSLDICSVDDEMFDLDCSAASSSVTSRINGIVAQGERPPVMSVTVRIRENRSRKSQQ